jgi:N-acyl-D-amino-acid deacylase
MREGALGVGSSLIYAPAFYAETDELVALMQAAAEFDGMYISHLRSEGNRWFEAIDELIEIARRAKAPAEIYHLKAAGRANWTKLDGAIRKIEAARAEGLRITADMYTYTAGATGLDASMPPWVQEGGTEAWIARLEDPAIRARVAAEMKVDATDWENLYAAAGSPDGLLLVGFKTEALKPLTGKTLGEVARQRGTSPEDTAIDLVIEDGTRVETVYFLMDEANVARQVAIPWVSFGSDAPAPAPEGVFLRSSQHPRAYGNVARLLGRYVRDERRLPLAEAIRKLTSQPAENLKVRERGRLREGYFADLAIFDPAAVADRATFAEPHQLAVGMRHVMVNGRFVLLDGESTSERPGRVVRGPGWLGWKGDPGENPVPSRP